MKKTVKKTPAYLTLYEQLKKEIVSGAYSYKSKLPSKRSAAERFGVSLVTIEHTYALLEDEGYIQGRQRCGYFVRYRKEQFFPSVPPRMPEKTQPEEFSSSLSLHSKYAGEPSTDQTPVPPLETDCFPPSVYAKAVRRVLSVYGDRILLKTKNAGLPLLREAIARYLLRTRTISVLPDQIVIGMIANYVAEHKHAKGCIFDGFPRTTVQAEEFDKILAGHGLHVDIMIDIHVPEEELIQRILLRGKDSGRADDASEEVIRGRLDVYRQQTAVVSDYYAAQGKYASVNGTGTMDDVFARITDVIAQL